MNPLYEHRYVDPETEEIKTIELDSRLLLQLTIDVYRILHSFDTIVPSENYEAHEARKAALKYLVHIQWKTKNKMIQERKPK